MTRRRRRGPGRESGAWLKALVVVCWLVVALAHWQGAIAAGYETADVSRSTGVDVVADTDAVTGIDPNGSVHVNATDRLVTVSNRFGQSVTVTVALRSNSTDIGDLVVGGTTVGDSATVDLASGSDVVVEISIPDDASLVGREVRFDVRAQTTGLYTNASNRSVPVEG
ncbi:hypothetical protein [Haloarchaeobius amylolyticus]|uniref:hypothetical protein n=1 Tax=Haloarchaeobius amylolyticus TaxID=1198296 RepID=UPI00226EA4D8|nr:hypothetical protein [Haloarchaeobius amylolyticus]